MIKSNVFSSFKERCRTVFRKKGNTFRETNSVSGNFNAEDIAETGAYANTGNPHKRSAAQVDIIRLT